MVQAGGGAAPRTLFAPGVRISLLGAAALRSEVPLGFALLSEGPWPLVLSGDPAGLDRLAALSSVYRVHSWLAELETARLHNWELGALEGRLARAQAAVLGGSTQFGMTAPFGGLDAARAEGSAALRSLLLVAGSAIAALAAFIVLTAAGLRREQGEDLAKLRAAGAAAGQAVIFVAGQSLALCAAGLLLGYAGALCVGALLAAAEGEGPATVLTHSLLTPFAPAALAASWVVGAALIAAGTQLRSVHVLNLAAAVAAAGVVAGLVLGTGDTSRSAVLLAPACSVAAGILVLRLMIWLLPAAERVARRGAVNLRLALVGLARAPGPPAAAIAFTCVAIALGGFALTYRATLQRGAADQAADRVPLDALISPGASFATPLEVEPISVWRSLSHGQVFPVQRTQASYQTGSSSATVPALGVPARALRLMHGWRSSDGSAPLHVLAGRLVMRGAVRIPGPTLPTDSRRVSVAAYSPQMAVNVTADLREPSGDVLPVALGTATATRRVLSAPIPSGRWELEAVELDEGTGVEVTNGHQNGENVAPTTQFSANLELGPIAALGLRGERLGNFPISRWTATGAAGATRSTGTGGVRIRFQASGLPGVVRPPEPSDTVAVPVLTDPSTAAAAEAGGQLQLTVDEQPVRARVVGVLRRFPTLSGASTFVVADEATLASALDAQLPGQGRPDELWLADPDSSTLWGALSRGSLVQLRAAFRTSIEHDLAGAPIARAMSGSLLAAAGVTGALAVIGLVLVLQGPFRDPRTEEDLAAQGLGPRALRAELRTRLWLAAGLGIVSGAGLSLLLTRLAVAAVGSLGIGAPPVPALVTIVPAAALGLVVAAAVVVAILTGSLAARWMIRDRGKPWPWDGFPRSAGDDVMRGEWVR
jgi:hypothetical protein